MLFRALAVLLMKMSFGVVFMALLILAFVLLIATVLQ